MKQKILKILYRLLAFCARKYISRHKITVIAITGSVGKTSCRMIIAQVLQQLVETQDVASLQKNIYTSPKNYNSELGLIFSIFQIEEYSSSINNLLKITLKIIRESIFSGEKYDILVAEYGIDAPGDMDFLLSVMQPDIGIITRLDGVHAANFPWGIEEYWWDKAKLLLTSKEKTFYNLADTFLAEKKEFFQNTETFFDEKISSNFSYEHNIFRQNFQYKKTDIFINLIGEENIHYTLLALRIAESMGIKISAKKYFFEFLQAPGRFSIYERNNNILIDSSYNAAPESMQLAIENTKKIQAEIFPEKEIIFVLWDMRELGETSPEAHKKLAKNIGNISTVFTIGPEMFQHFIPELKAQNFLWEIHSSLSSRGIGKKLKKFLKENPEKEYIILFKGSQNTIFVEEALAEILTPTQRKNLVRQSLDWNKKKEDFFQSL